MRDDRGSVLILGAGAVAVGFLVLVVGVDASAAFLQRRALVNLADASALAGAQAIDLSSYYREGASSATRLDPARVHGRVVTFLEGSGAAQIGGLALDQVTTDGTTVTVRLSAPLQLPFLSGAMAERVQVEAQARLAYRAAD